MAERSILDSADDVTEAILDSVADCVEGWFLDESLGTEEFIDRLCDGYGTDFDIESYDNPAVRKIMAHARKVRRESRG